jgi:hypothetical protein
MTSHNKIRVLCVDDDPRIWAAWQSDSTLGDNIEIVACDDRLAADHVKGAYEARTPFDVLILDFIYKTTGSTVGRVLEQISAVCAGYKPAVYPAIILYSGAPSSTLQRAAKEINLETKFRNTVAIVKPGNSEVIKNTALQLAGETRVNQSDSTNSTIAVTPPPNLESILEAFEKFRGSLKSSTDRPARTIQTRDDFERQLLSMAPEEMLRPYRATVDLNGKKPASCEFSDAVGDTLVGRVAFSLADIEALRAENAETPIILATSEGGTESINALSLVQGVIVIGERAGHFRQVAGAMGKSSLMTDIGLAAAKDMSLLSDTLLLNRETTLRCGDFVTIDTHERLLYAGSHAVIPANRTELYSAFADYARSLLEHCANRLPKKLMPPLPPFISAQVDFPEDAKYRPESIGLSRTENYYVSTEGKKLLLQAILDPTPENLAVLRNYTAKHVSDALGRTFWPTIRLMDFKPDQFIGNPQIETRIKEKYNLADLRGFALARALPELYRAQIEGVMQGLWLEKGSGVVFSIPHAEEIQDIDRVRDILGQADIPYDASIRIGVTIETKKGVQNVMELAQSSVDGEMYRIPHILVGSTDLTEDLTGIARNDDQAIRRWIQDSDAIGSPFRTIFPQLSAALGDIAAIRKSGSFDDVGIRVCGEHTTNFDLVAVLPSLGIREISVPSRPIWLDGLRNALAVRCVQYAMINGAPLLLPTA